jgi:HEAT repeat protein
VIGARPKSDPARSAALFSLSRVEKPTQATLAWFEALVDAPGEPRSQAALLGLGRLAGQVAANEPERGREVLLRLLQRVQQSVDENARAFSLLAVGNAGAPELEHELAPWTASTSVMVRRAAISAYRLIPTVSARDVMLQALANDQDPSVRYAALEGVLLRPPDNAIVDAVADRLEHDVDASVKKPCASRLIGLCQRNQHACRHIGRLKVSGDDWTRNELTASRK